MPCAPPMTAASTTSAPGRLPFDFLKPLPQQQQEYFKRFLQARSSSSTTTMTIEIDSTTTTTTKEQQQQQEESVNNGEEKEEETKSGSEPELLTEAPKEDATKGNFNETQPAGGAIAVKDHQLAEEVNGTKEEEEESATGKEVVNGGGAEPTTTTSTTADDTANNSNNKEGGEEKKEKDQEDGGGTNNNVMALNVAYEALEQVRQANICIEFGRELGPKECVHCLREPQPTTRRWGSRISKAVARSAFPCLTCGNPVCANKHRCPELKRENINICIDCASFFSLDEFVTKIHNTNDKSLRRQQMNGMLDVYDRALLILQYSSQYIEEIAQALERNTERNNKIGFGSSATGFVSGIAGVAAAVTIFTPAGPPLLIASILFGGGATAASASSEAVNYHCSANKMADTIYALHGMVHSISRLAIEGHLWEQEKELAAEAAAEEKGGVLAEKSTDDNAGGNTTPTNNNQRTHQAQARNWGRATANALKPLTAGALSAASVVMEAREMRNTLDKINAGNPCEKADSLRNISQEMDMLPSTSLLAEIAPRFFKLE